MNWVEVIALLKEAGFSQSQIADACRCSQSVVSELGTGRITDPRDSIGQALRSLAAKAQRRIQRRGEKVKARA